MSTPEINEKIIIKCDKHSEIISTKMLTLYKDKKLFDSVLLAGSESIKIHAHSVVLYSFSGYFAEMFDNNKPSERDAMHITIDVKNIEASALQDIIDFMYTGKLEICLESAEKYLRIGVQLKIQTLIDCCCEMVEKTFNSKNSFNWLRIARELCIPVLKTKLLKNIYTFLEEWHKNKEFLTLSLDEIKDLLFNDNPYGDIEESVFLTMVAWIDFDKTNRESLLFELLSLVRFWKLTPEFIVKNRHKVCKTMESYELLCSWLEWHLSPETRIQKYQSLTPLKSRRDDRDDQLEVVSFANDKICFHSLNKNEGLWKEENIIESPFKSKQIYSMAMMDNNIVFVYYNYKEKYYEVSMGNMQALEHPVYDTHILKNKQIFARVYGRRGNLCLLAYDSNLKSCNFEIYNFPNKKWSRIQFPEGVQIFTRQFSINNSNIFLVDSEKSNLNIYDLSAKVWTVPYELPRRVCEQEIFATESDLYFFSATTVQCLNLKTKTWRDLEPIPDKMCDSYTSSFYSFDKNIILSCETNIAELNTQTGKWKILASLPLEHKSSKYALVTK